MTSREKLIYLAGIVDGEGHFYRVRHKGGTGGYSTSRRLVVTNTNKELVDWLKHEFDGHITFYERRSKNPKHSDCYRWSIDNAKAVALATRLRPFMIVKREQIKSVLNGGK